MHGMRGWADHQLWKSMLILLGKCNMSLCVIFILLSKYIEYHIFYLTRFSICIHIHNYLYLYSTIYTMGIFQYTEFLIIVCATLHGGGDGISTEALPRHILVNLPRHWCISFHPRGVQLRFITKSTRKFLVLMFPWGARNHFARESFPFWVRASGNIKRFH